MDDLHHLLEQVVEGGHHPLGVGALGKAGEVADVDEHDRDLDLLAVQIHALVQDPFGHIGIHVGAERFADPLALLRAPRPSC